MKKVSELGKHGNERSTLNVKHSIHQAGGVLAQQIEKL